jgi:hypothetical protein
MGRAHDALPLAFLLPASLSAGELQGAGTQAEAKVFTIMCTIQKMHSMACRFSCLHFKEYQSRITCREASSARTSKSIKNLLKERCDFNLVGIAAVKSCNDQEA